MPDLERLHTEVVQDPESDEPRLAYARAVEPSDPDRAEFIRVQVALIRSLRQPHTRGSLADQYTKEDLLLERHRERWARDVIALGCVTRINFLRGFVEWVTMSARAFLDHANQLYRVAPILHVDFTDLRPLARDVFASPLLDRLHSIGLMRNHLGDAEIELLASSSHIGRLRFLELSNNKIGQAGLEALCASDRLPSLRYLGFRNNLAPDPTPQIAETDTLTNEIVRIEQNRFGRELEQRYGKKAWLSAETFRDVSLPQRGVL